MSEDTFSCRECVWVGTEPIHRYWSVSSFYGATGGSYALCPECENTVRTEKGWHRHDNPTFLDNAFNYTMTLLAIATIPLAILAIAMFLSS